MAKLENKKIDPMVGGYGNAFLMLGYFMLGQTSKGIYALVASVIGVFLCVVPAWIIIILAVMDGLEVAKAVAAGKKIDENEYKNENLFKIMRIIHRDAVYKG